VSDFSQQFEYLGTMSRIYLHRQSLKSQIGRWLMVWLCFACWARAVDAQHPLSYSITTEQGMPSNEVYELAQDDFGFVWIACNSGLYRYDGIRFRRFGTSAEKGKAIINVYHDADDHIWCRNPAGQLFIVGGDSLRLLFEPRTDNPLPAMTAFAPDGQFFAYEQFELKRYDPTGKLLSKWLIPPPNPERWYPSDLYYHRGKVYFQFSMGGLVRLDLKSGGVELLTLGLDGRTEPLGGGFFERGNQLFMRSPDPSSEVLRLFRLDGTTFVQVWEFPNPQNRERWLRLTPTDTGSIWIHTNNGTAMLAETPQGWTLGPKLFTGNQVSGNLHDREGNTWFSTLNTGLTIVPDLRIHRLDIENPLLTQNFSAIGALSDGTVLAGTYSGGLVSIDLSNGKIEPRYEALSSKPYAVKKIRPLRDGVIVSQRVSHYHMFTGTVADPLPLTNSRDMLLVGDTVFDAAPEAILFYPRSTWKTAFPDSLPRLRKVGGRALEREQPNGPLYMACNDGTFFRRRGSIQEFRLHGKPVIASTFCPGKNGIWVATLNDGLLLLHDGELVKQYGKSAGMPELWIRNVIEVGNMLIFSSENYLSKLDLTTGKTQSLSRSAGFSPADINQLTVADEKIWLATNKGILTIPLDFEVSSHVAPNVRIAEVFVNERAVQKKGIIDLPNDNRNLRIVFEGTSFSSRGNFAFEYRIAGLDTTWVSTGAAANYAIFSALPPGSYNFEVRTVDENGEHSISPAQLQFSVEAPYYLKVWFWALVLATVVIVTLGIFQVRLRFIRRRHHLEQQYIASQLTALKAQMNPHFMFNAINSIQDLVISRDIRNSNLYLSKFSSLMRKVLDASGNEMVLLDDEVEMLRLYLELEQLRFGSDFEFVIDLVPELQNRSVLLPSMIIQPFVENAIKHGLLHKKGTKRLEISFSLGGGLICTITDNGVGRKRSAEIKARAAKTHTSFSTKATVKRLDLIQQLYGSEVALEIVDLEANGEALGTRVEITLPMRENA
jgi:ligand-binding sensor domain-containing protein/two-component sensor histidine kinase